MRGSYRELLSTFSIAGQVNRCSMNGAQENRYGGVEDAGKRREDPDIHDSVRCMSGNDRIDGLELNRPRKDKIRWIRVEP